MTRPNQMHEDEIEINAPETTVININQPPAQQQRSEIKDLYPLENALLSTGLAVFGIYVLVTKPSSDFQCLGAGYLSAALSGFSNLLRNHVGENTQIGRLAYRIGNFTTFSAASLMFAGFGLNRVRNEHERDVALGLIIK